MSVILVGLTLNIWVTIYYTYIITEISAHLLGDSFLHGVPLSKYKKIYETCQFRFQVLHDKYLNIVFITVGIKKMPILTISEFKNIN